ncbi:hypothetical protein FS837_002304 [Tulasnella sp. UAMH 9824]|nr:hypothetical protein FS837_002304 [Tulasnella sp. UAMH 9824]
MFREGLGLVSWPAYWSYAHRVREVHITDEAEGRASRVQINPLALLHASSAATSQPGHSALLPRARTLAFDFHHPSDPSLILPLIGPTVRHITIKIPQPTEQVIQATSIASSTLTSMSRNLTLEKFDVTIGDGFKCATTGTRANTQRTLDFNITRFVTRQQALQCLRICPLDSLASLALAIRILPSLRALKITCVTSSQQAPASNTYNLPRHVHLISLDLSGLGTITLNAANVKDMGKAWIKLESLQFSVVGDGLPVDLLLTVAASFSPSLHHLAIPLDISSTNFMCPLGPNISSHDLKLLYTGPPVKESHIQPFAELLGTLFRPGFHVIFGVGAGGLSGIMEVAAFCEKDISAYLLNALLGSELSVNCMQSGNRLEKAAKSLKDKAETILSP